MPAFFKFTLGNTYMLYVFDMATDLVFAKWEWAGLALDAGVLEDRLLSL